jgi:hypothetical protein
MAARGSGTSGLPALRYPPGGEGLELGDLAVLALLVGLAARSGDGLEVLDDAPYELPPLEVPTIGQPPHGGLDGLGTVGLDEPVELRELAFAGGQDATPRDVLPDGGGARVKVGQAVVLSQRRSVARASSL